MLKFIDGRLVMAEDESVGVVYLPDLRQHSPRLSNCHRATEIQVHLIIHSSADSVAKCHKLRRDVEVQVPPPRPTEVVVDPQDVATAAGVDTDSNPVWLSFRHSRECLLGIPNGHPGMATDLDNRFFTEVEAQPDWKPDADLDYLPREILNWQPLVESAILAPKRDRTEEAMRIKKLADLAHHKALRKQARPPPPLRRVVEVQLDWVGERVLERVGQVGPLVDSDQFGIEEEATRNGGSDVQFGGFGLEKQTLAQLV
jgi:hypothetical protein